MKAHWRKLISHLPSGIEKKIYHLHFRHLHRVWERQESRTSPSHFLKQQFLRRCAMDGDCKILVETGTYMGDMVFALQDDFKQIFSIELSPYYFNKAKERFGKFQNIEIIQGDSGVLLKQIVPRLDDKALFWLDGHYSGGLTAKGEKECPIYEELRNIFTSPINHTIVIDDARLFVGQQDYPTIEELEKFVQTLKPTSKFSFENDAIVIT